MILYNKTKTFKTDEYQIQLLSKIKNKSKFIREAINEKFERDKPIAVKKTTLKQLNDSFKFLNITNEKI